MNNFDWFAQIGFIVCKMHSCYKDTQKFWATFHSYPNDSRWLQRIDVNNPLQKVFKSVNTVRTYSNLISLKFDKSIIILVTNNLTLIWEEG